MKTGRAPSTCTTLSSPTRGWNSWIDSRNSSAPRTARKTGQKTAASREYWRFLGPASKTRLYKLGFAGDSVMKKKLAMKGEALFIFLRNSSTLESVWV